MLVSSGGHLLGIGYGKAAQAKVDGSGPDPAVLAMVLIVDMSIGVMDMGKCASKVIDVVVVCKVTGVGISLPSGLHDDPMNKLVTFVVHMSFVVIVVVPGGAKQGVVALDSVVDVNMMIVNVKTNVSSV